MVIKRNSEFFSRTTRQPSAQEYEPLIPEDDVAFHTVSFELCNGIWCGWYGFSFTHAEFANVIIVYTSEEFVKNLCRLVRRVLVNCLLHYMDFVAVEVKCLCKISRKCLSGTYIYLVSLLDAANKVIDSFPRTPHRQDVVRCTDDPFYRLRVYSAAEPVLLK